MAESTLAEKQTRARGSESSSFFARLCFSLERCKSLGKWLAATFLMVTVMRAVANRSLTYEKPAQNPGLEISDLAPARSGNGESNWWLPENAFPDPAIDSAGQPSGADTVQEGRSVFSIDRSVQLNSGPLAIHESADAEPTIPIAKQPMYAILGLDRSSTLPATGNRFAEENGADLHFSLSGNLAATPTYSFSSEPVALGIPEPSPWSMCSAAIGISLLNGRRLRTSSRRRSHSYS